MPNSAISRNVWPNYHSSNITNAAKRNTGDVLGQDQFMKILIAQLRNQDPMQPMEDRDFIAQMAQFSSVEQLRTITSELALLRQNIGTASNIIGKEVQWYEYDDKGDVVSVVGIVDSIVLKDGILFAKIGDSEVAIDYLISISEPKAVQPEQPEGPEEPEGTDPPTGEGGEDTGEIGEDNE